MSEKIKQRRSIFTWICAVVMAIIFLVVPVPGMLSFRERRKTLRSMFM